MRKYIATFLALIIMFSSSTSILSVSATSDYFDNIPITFIDAEGKNNSMQIDVNTDSSVIVAHFIEGELNSIANIIPVGDDIHVVLLDKNGNEIQNSVESVADYVIAKDSIYVNDIEHISRASGFTYFGRIEYFKHTPGPGLLITHAHKLSFHKRYDSSQMTTYTARAKQGLAVNALVGTIVSILSNHLLSMFVSQLVSAIISSVAGCVVGGIFQFAIEKDYSVITEYYTIRVSEDEADINKYYSGTKRQVIYPDGQYASDKQSFGYFQIRAMGELVYEDFWPSCDFAGISYVEDLGG